MGWTHLMPCAVEVDQLNEQTTPDLNAILGDNFSPFYEKLLRFIPFGQLHDMQKEPLGRGKFGSVYAATWRPPRGALDVRQYINQPVEIKLGLADSRQSEQARLKRYLHEV